MAALVPVEEMTCHINLPKKAVVLLRKRHAAAEITPWGCIFHHGTRRSMILPMMRNFVEYVPCPTFVLLFQIPASTLPSTHILRVLDSYQLPVDCSSVGCARPHLHLPTQCVFSFAP